MTIHQHLDGGVSIRYGPHLIGKEAMFKAFSSLRGLDRSRLDLMFSDLFFDRAHSGLVCCKRRPN